MFDCSLEASASPSTAIAIGGLAMFLFSCSWLTSASFSCSSTVWSPPEVPRWLCSASFSCSISVPETLTFFCSFSASECPSTAIATGGLRMFAFSCSWLTSASFDCSSTVCPACSSCEPFGGSGMRLADAVPVPHSASARAAAAVQKYRFMVSVSFRSSVTGQRRGEPFQGARGYARRVSPGARAESCKIGCGQGASLGRSLRPNPGATRRVAAAKAASKNASAPPPIEADAEKSAVSGPLGMSGRGACGCEEGNAALSTGMTCAAPAAGALENVVAGSDARPTIAGSGGRGIGGSGGRRESRRRLDRGRRCRSGARRRRRRARAARDARSAGRAARRPRRASRRTGDVANRLAQDVRGLSQRVREAEPVHDRLRRPRATRALLGRLLNGLDDGSDRPTDRADRVVHDVRHRSDWVLEGLGSRHDCRVRRRLDDLRRGLDHRRDGLRRLVGSLLHGLDRRRHGLVDLVGRLF